jgi:hypothetical protein
MLAETETAILSRIIEPQQGVLPPELAEFLLKLDFPEADHERMAELSAKASDGTLNPEERQELEGYTNVGHFLALLQSKARVSLRGRSRTPAA